MPELSIKLSVEQANEDFYKSVEGIAAHTQLGLERAWWKSAKDIRATFDKQVLDRKSKSGRIYILKRANGSRRKHQASAHNESPANLSGTYRKSFNWNLRGAKELAVGVTAEYGKYLENGTKDKHGETRMLPRPGIKNAITASERDIIRNLATEVENYL